ncbi:hypothetical protein J4209_05060 [Candidatus Woesearchaeota archaeon]|nr:hypothetical protein [Candidatus Woesearchaeota archaeon]
MATFLDITGLEYFSNFFVFLLTWLVVYALLLYTKIVGGNKAIAALIGLFIGLFVLFSPIATGVVSYIAPWFAVVFIFIILATVVLKVFGASSFEIESYGSLKWVAIILIFIVLIVGALSYVREQTVIPGENETGVREYSSTISIIFHPKILGAIFVLVMAVFTIALLAAKTR